MGCIKQLVIIFNTLFFLIGGGLIALGAYVNVKLGDFKNASEVNYITAANLVIGVGVMIALISFLGCCGAMQLNKCMLLAFAIFLTIIFLLEIAAGVVAYLFRGKVEKKLKEGMKKKLARYDDEEAIKRSMDALQKYFKCCGVDSSADYNGRAQGVPASCGNSTNGCVTKFQDLIKKNLLIVGICGIVFAVVQILGISFAIKLYKDVAKDNYA